MKLHGVMISYEQFHDIRVNVNATREIYLLLACQFSMITPLTFLRYYYHIFIYTKCKGSVIDEAHTSKRFYLMGN